MFLGIPNETPYDLKFNIGPVPVRVHPLFWLMGLILGGMGGSQGPQMFVDMLLWVAVLFISILVHELGHVFAFNHFGLRSRVALYMMGGLAIPEQSGYSQRVGPKENIIISAAGPIAGFLLAALILLVVKTTGGDFEYSLIFGFIPYFSANPQAGAPAIWGQFLNDMLDVNIFWGLVNLVPIFPLDGGQISRSLFRIFDPMNAVPRSLMISVGAGALLAFWGFSNGQLFIGLLFGSLAYSSWQMLQAGGRGRY